MDYPKFYEIDGLLIVITGEGDDVAGLSVPSGKPYPPFKAMGEGEELTRLDFLAKLKERYPDSKMAAMF